MFIYILHSNVIYSVSYDDIAGKIVLYSIAKNDQTKIKSELSAE